MLLAITLLVACGEDEKEGCTDIFALNYDADADTDNGTCTYSSVGFLASQVDNLQIDTRFTETLVSFTVEVNGTILGEITAASSDNTCTPAADKLTYQFVSTNRVDVKYTLVSEIEGSGQRTMRSKTVSLDRTNDECRIIDISEVFSDADEVTFYACNDPLSINFNEEAPLGEISCRYSKIIFYTSRSEGFDFGEGFLEDLMLFVLNLEGSSETLGIIEQAVTDDLSDCTGPENTVLYQFEGPDEITFDYFLRTIENNGSLMTGRRGNITIQPTTEECIVVNIVDFIL